MKTVKIIYWISTGLVALGMILGAYRYFTDPSMVLSYKHLGYPDYLRVQIGILKIIGALVLILPKIPSKIKEWAYAGFGILFISATIAHIAAHDSITLIVLPIVFFVILAISNYTFSKSK
jgi:hypothetical protein